MRSPEHGDGRPTKQARQSAPNNKLLFDPQSEVAGFLGPNDLRSYGTTSQENNDAARGTYRIVHFETFNADIRRIDRFQTQNPGDPLGPLIFRFPANEPIIATSDPSPRQSSDTIFPWMMDVTDLRFEQSEDFSMDRPEFRMTYEQWMTLWRYMSALSDRLTGLTLRFNRATMRVQDYRTEHALVKSFRSCHNIRRLYLGALQPDDF
jgi:hypothetical protein